MPIFDNHVDEVCEDIREQYEKGIANCALFSMTLVPEGNPPVNKAEMLGKKYGVYKKKLDSMGLRNGILVQATIGHGRLLGASSPFVKLDGLNPSAKKSDVCCPYDDGFCNYMRIEDAELFMRDGKFDSAFDRIHTAFHGYLRKKLDYLNETYNESDTLSQLFNKLHSHMSSQLNSEYSDIVRTTLRSASGIISSINDLRNKFSLVHPNQCIISSREAEFCIKLVKELSDYVEKVV